MLVPAYNNFAVAGNGAGYKHVISGVLTDRDLKPTGVNHIGMYCQ